MMTRKTRMIFVEEVTDTNKPTPDNLFKKFDMEADDDPQADEKKEKSASRSHETARRSRSHETVKRKKKKCNDKRGAESWHEGDCTSVWEEKESGWKNKDSSWEEEGDAWPADSGENKHDVEFGEGIDNCSDDPSNEKETKPPAQNKDRPKSSLSLSIKRLPKIFTTNSSDGEMFSNALVTSNAALTSVPPIASPDPSLSGAHKQPAPIFHRGPPARPKVMAMHQGTNEMRTIEESLLYEKLKKLFVCMMITGIFFVRQQRTSIGSRTRFIRNCTLQQVYCSVILFTLTLNFIRSLTAFSGEDFNNILGAEVFFKLLTAMFFYESMSRAFLAYVASYRKNGGLRELFLYLEKIFYTDNIIPYDESLTRISYIFIILTFFISACNVGVTAYGFFGPDKVQELFNFYLAPINPELDGILAFKIFLLILTFVNAQVAILTMSFYSVICYVLYKEFEYFCRTFAMKIREDGTFTDNVEKFRINHQRRCKVVAQADQMFKYYIANTYMTNIPMLCLLLYTVVYSEYDDSYRFISVFRLCYVLLQMLLVSAAATIINSQAHAPLASIYSIRVLPSTTPERQLQVNMFLNKLTGTQIGLTAWDMFVINKPAVLTVIGMIITYFFLLIQFKSPLAGSGGTEHICCICCNDTSITTSTSSSLS